MGGYWAMHKYKRGSVLRDSSLFVGYDYLRENVFWPLEYTNQWRQKQAVIAALFQTGGRISEVLSLTKSNFYEDPGAPDMVVILDMPILKLYTKEEEYYEVVDRRPVSKATGEPLAITRLYKKDPKTGKWRRKRWKTKRKIEYRDIRYPRDEPLHEEYLQPWIDQVEGEKLFSLNYQAVYHALYRLKVKKTPLTRNLRNFYPHWFRAQRAAHLRQAYGFDQLDLMEFFGWRTHQMAARYARIGGIGLGEKMRMARQRLEEGAH
ncbi:MAG: site-specific integrase [Deltaproteobacteria bacterium]|nr:site-specific integrase [Deltaproteobacteria bacterium]